MWLDADGVAHTVALPDPTELMSAEFVRALDALVAAEPDEVEDAISTAEDELFDADLSALETRSGADEFVGVAPPPHILDGPLRTVVDLAEAVRATDLRWRLDAVLALSDYVS